jgi:putative tricarboxylic transport membrane protein
MIARRDLLGTTMLGGAAMAALGARPAAAQQAIESLRMFIPAAPGGGWDQTGRSMEQALRAAGMVRGFQFDNVAGAGGAVGLPRFVNGMRGQANTLMVAGLVMVGATITNRSPNNLTQVTPIAKLTEEAEIVVVPASSPHRTMQDLVTAFRANPGAISWAGGSAGGTDHILAGLIAKTLGIEARRVSYVAFAGGGPATAAIIGSQVTAGISGVGEFVEQIRAGRMRALAISSEARLQGLDVPTLKESGIDVALTNWRGVFAPPGVNDASKAAMIDLMTRMNATSQWREICQQRDWVQSFIVGDAYKAFVESEIQRITGVLRDLGLAG